MYLTILILPLLGSIVSGFLGRKIGVTGSHFVTIMCLVITSLLSVIAFYEVGIMGSPVSIQLTSWIDSEIMSVSWGFLFDSLTVSMLLPVLFVSTLVHIYSTNYMSEDPHNQRFFSYLSLFTFFMIVLVTGDNYLILFLGWEGIGIASYLLINFWYTRINANKAGVLALTQNRVGDTLFSIGLFGIFWLFGNLDFATVFSIAPYMNETSLTIISLLLLGGAMLKSAQLFTNWLPISMEGFLSKYIYIIICFLLILYIFLDLLLYNKGGIDFSVNIKLFAECSVIPVSVLPLPKNIMDPLIGNLLGDGHLGYNNKNKEGKYTGNVWYSMTLKSKEYTYYLWGQIYSPICTATLPFPWPSPKTGKPATQYNFHTRSLPILTEMHSLWYVWNKTLNKYIKIVPLNIGNLISPIGLAHWIMDDGYWSEGCVFLCTDSFTSTEIDLLICVLQSKFGLLATKQRRIKGNKEVCWRIRFSKANGNILKLRSLVQSYFIPTML